MKKIDDLSTESCLKWIFWLIKPLNHVELFFKKIQEKMFIHMEKWITKAANEAIACSTGSDARHTAELVQQHQQHSTTIQLPMIAHFGPPLSFQLIRAVEILTFLICSVFFFFFLFEGEGGRYYLNAADVCNYWRGGSRRQPEGPRGNVNINEQTKPK